VSNTDGFIEEVTEEVRKDQLFSMYKKYGWVAVLAIVGLVGGTGLVEYRKASDASQAQARGDAIISALNQDDVAARSEALATIVNAGGDEAAVAQLHRAGVLLEEDDIAGALAIYDGLKAGTDIYAQVATLKAITLRGNEMDMDQRMLDLDALSVAGNPFRTVALEQKAIALIDAGKTDDAIALMISLLDEAGVSQAMQSRTRQLIVALGGDVPIAPGVVQVAE
tara:strand:- start:10577 stop:11248 length:672 start_codon:yes stop_codon:yes gene_type:complete